MTCVDRIDRAPDLDSLTARLRSRTGRPRAIQLPRPRGRGRRGVGR